MSYADKVFKEMCRDILDNGVSTEGEKVRPIWEDTNESAAHVGNCMDYPASAAHQSEHALLLYSYGDFP